MDMDSHQTQGTAQPTATYNSTTVVYIEDEGPPFNFERCTRYDPRVLKKCRCKYCREYDAEHNAYLRSFWELVNTLEPRVHRMRKVDSSQNKRVLKEPIYLLAPSFGDGMPATG